MCPFVVVQLCFTGGGLLGFKFAYNTRRIANRETISRNVFSHHTTGANNGMVSKRHTGKYDRARADPHVIFDYDLCGEREYLSALHAMLVTVQYKRIVTQQAVAADLNFVVRRNR